MRFHLGPIPELEDFTTDGRWQAISEPGPLLMQFCALPLGLAAFLAVGWGWFSLMPHPAPSLSAWEVATLGVVFVAAFPVIIMVHELIHAAFHPDCGRSRYTVLGFWPSMLIFYAHYEGPLSRNRFLAVFLAPFVVISILPLMAAGVWSPPPVLYFTAAWCSTWNALCACGDLFGAALIFFQVPRRAIVRNLGWRTYWTVSEAESAVAGGSA